MSETAFSCLDQMQKTIFTIYIQRDYFGNENKYERKLQQQKIDFFKKSLKKPSVTNDKIFEIIISLANLRYRVTDHTTFEVCEKEFVLLSESLSKIFQEFNQQKKNEESLALFSSIVDAFEDVYRSALQVVAEDPLMFLIFMENLRELYHEFGKIV